MLDQLDFIIKLLETSLALSLESNSKGLHSKIGDYLAVGRFSAAKEEPMKSLKINCKARNHSEKKSL